MDDRYTSNRIKFKNKNDQSKYLMDAKQKLDISWKKIANILHIHQRTLRDWVREEFKMSHKSLKILEKITKIKAHDYIIVDFNKHLSRISSLGGKANLMKNKLIGGDKLNRKEKWYEWYEKGGKEKLRKSRIININIPEFSVDLAEFVGIMLGDGGIAPHHISVTLNSLDEKKYSTFIIKLIKNLFNVTPKIYFKKESHALDIVVHRKLLVDFCLEIGLKKGNKIKQNIDIPDWIKSNQDFAKSCLCGLFDTDGSVYKHSYFSKGKKYSYTKISFSSASPLLISSVSEILKNIGFYARIGRQCLSVHIDSRKDVDRFVSLIGTHNPKHKMKLNRR